MMRFGWRRIFCGGRSWRCRRRCSLRCRFRITARRRWPAITVLILGSIVLCMILGLEIEERVWESRHRDQIIMLRAQGDAADLKGFTYTAYDDYHAITKMVGKRSLRDSRLRSTVES